MKEIAFGAPLPQRDRADDDLIKTLIHYTVEKVSIFDVLDVFNIPYRGRRRQKIRCIFPLNHLHGDRNPSGHINPKKNRYTCYSCGEGGDPVFVAKFLGRFNSIGETIAFLNKELYLNLDTDPELQRLLKHKEQPVNELREKTIRTRYLEDQVLNRAVAFRNIVPSEQYRTRYLPVIEHWWDEWDFIRETGDNSRLLKSSLEFLGNLRGLLDVFRRERRTEEVRVEELILWG